MMSFPWVTTISTKIDSINYLRVGEITFRMKFTVKTILSINPGRIQNMDPSSMDPFMDPVHGLSLWTTPYFVKLQAEKSLDERGK